MHEPTLPPATPEPPDDEAYAFAPAPGRARRDGWTAERQRTFIAMLRKCGSVSQAAKSVGKSCQSAYKLRARPGASDFARVWDCALGEARCEAFDLALERIRGVWEPRFYRGHYVGMRRYDDVRLAMSALRASDAWASQAKGEKRTRLR